jgi:hypothetical protein
MEVGQDFAGARQGENAGLRRHDRGRGGNGRTAASRMRGSGRFRVGLPRARGRRRSSLDRRPGVRAIWQFGAQGSYLIDFYNVCEYLSAAAEAIAANAAAREAWMETQKDALKTGRLANVLRQLARHFVAPRRG